LEFQADDLLLVGREPIDQIEDLGRRVAPLGERPGRRIGAFLHGQCAFRERLHALFLSPHVYRLIPANGVQPFHEVPVELGSILPPQLEKRLLDDVAGMVFIADDSPRVPQQVPLKSQEDSPHPLGFDRVSVIHPRLIR
jgi:hypothetical protein